MGVKGEGNRSQADNYMAVNNTVMVTNHYRIFKYRYKYLRGICGKLQVHVRQARAEAHIQLYM